MSVSNWLKIAAAAAFGGVAAAQAQALHTIDFSEFDNHIHTLQVVSPYRSGGLQIATQSGEDFTVARASSPLSTGSQALYSSELSDTITFKSDFNFDHTYAPFKLEGLQLSGGALNTTTHLTLSGKDANGLALDTKTIDFSNGATVGSTYLTSTTFTTLFGTDTFSELDILYTGASNRFQMDNISFSAVPEPATCACIAGATALAAVVWARRRRGARLRPNLAAATDY